MDTKKQLTGPECAAIMIMYLDRKVAKKLLEKMGDEEIRAIGMAMATIDRVDPDIIESVIRTFVRDLAYTLHVPSTGPEFVDQILPDLIDTDRKDNIIPMLRRRVDRSFERFIAQRASEAVAALLKDERPQSQAVSLSLMGTDNAARILKHFTPEEQLEITLRMARLKQIPGDLADDVTSALCEGLGKMDDHLNVGGVDKTARMLGRMKRSDNDAILFAVSDEDEELADQLRRRMVVFEDLLDLSGRSVQVLVKEVAREDLLIALKWASPEIQDLFFANVSRRAAEDLRDDMTLLSHQPRVRVRAAQEHVVSVALKLSETGAIYLPMGEDEELAV